MRTTSEYLNQKNGMSLRGAPKGRRGNPTSARGRLLRFARNDNKGFTFIEVILVVVVLGFIAISAIPKDDEGLAPLSLDAAARKVTLDIRYAQNLAMTTGDNYGFQTTGASTYEIYEVATGDIALSPYSNSPMQEDLTDNFGDITFQNQNYQIEFNSYGRPSIGGGTNVQLNYINNSKTIQITATSGYITLL